VRVQNPNALSESPFLPDVCVLLSRKTQSAFCTLHVCLFLAPWRRCISFCLDKSGSRRRHFIDPGCFSVTEYWYAKYWAPMDGWGWHTARRVHCRRKNDTCKTNTRALVEGKFLGRKKLSAKLSAFSAIYSRRDQSLLQSRNLFLKEIFISNGLFIRCKREFWITIKRIFLEGKSLAKLIGVSRHPILVFLLVCKVLETEKQTKLLKKYKLNINDLQLFKNMITKKQHKQDFQLISIESHVQ
jgi:hypothetical protein